MMKKLLLTLPILFIYFLVPSVTFAQAPNLGVASSFALYTSAGAVSNTGNSTEVTGDVGTNVGAFSAFPPGTINGMIYLPGSPTAAQAATDVGLAYSDLFGRTPDYVIGNPILGNGQVLSPGVYSIGEAATLNGDLILDGGGCEADGFFLIQIDGALSTNTNSKVILRNGASLCNVYWQVNGAVDLGTNSDFRGTIVAGGAISLADGASLSGRGLTTAGAISLSTNIVSITTQSLEITCPPDIEVEWESATDLTMTGMATATDVEDECGVGSIRYEDVIVQGSCLGEATITRTWIATDRCGNEVSCIQMITTVDTEAPTPVSCPPTTVIDCSAGDPLVIITPIYNDNCTAQGDIVVTTRIDSVGFGADSEEARAIYVHFYAEDLCGNVDSTCTQIFICELEEEECPTLNCYGDIHLDLNADCEIQITPDMLLTQPLDPVLWPYCEIILTNEFGGIITGNILDFNDVGKTFYVTIRCELPGCAPLECSTTITLGRGDCTVTIISDLQPGSGPNISEGKINVYWNNIPAPSDHIPMVTDYTPKVQPDWVMHFPCDELNDTAEVIFRTWEIYDKEGNLSTLTDTIVVFRFPKLTPDAFLGSAEDSFYCELVPVPNDGELLKRYAAWKQPVGLHDYELPYTKLRGVTYEIPSTIVAAGLINAYAQGTDVYNEYLKCVILRKADGTEITIDDIISGRYITNLIASATDQQKLYGFLQLLIEFNENPVKVVVETVVFNFFPYLLLQEGDWILSAGGGGNFEKVTSDWFYNGHGNSPFWFSGGWPSIYGSGDCVSYCDVGAHQDFECIRVQIPALNIEDGFDPENCDTICLPIDDTSCGITITQDPLAGWTGSCPQTRGVDSWITQVCWAETPNYCAEDAFDGEEPIPCEELSADDNPDDVVVDYSCTNKAVKIHISQWQTLIDTIGPIFDFCYPTEWDQEEIKEAIRNGEQYDLAYNWERDVPTTYRVGSHDCAADVFVPSVKVIDNCSGVHSVKAMVVVKGGTRSVAMELTDTEIKILATGDTCYILTYSHTQDPIRIPFSGCNGELTEVRYEAADNCWNQSEWSKFIRVTDDVPPTVITNRNLNVALSNKIAWSPAINWDEGSWDNCAIDLRLGRRSDWATQEAMVDLCADLGVNAPYNNWVDLLVDLGVNRSQATTAIGGGVVGATTFNGKYNVDALKTFLNDGEVEQHYFNQIVWLWEDEELCGKKVVHAWIYAIASYIAENCAEADEHGNGLNVRDLEAVFDNLLGQPGYGNELALMGGGWSKDVPFKCVDACEAVPVELLVLDNCCNWGIGRSTMNVEDKGNATLVKQLPDLNISCESYNIFYKDIVDAASDLGENGSVSDSSHTGLDRAGAFSDLNNAFGHYIATWVDNQNRPTDIDGNLLPDSVTNFDYWNVTCEEKSETKEIGVERHDGTLDWITKVTKTTFLDTAVLTAANGIIGINCAGSYEQDVWVDLDECGQGTITRRFFVTSGCGPDAPSWEVQQVINVKSACGMRESMFDLPAHVGSKNAPICLPQGLSKTYLPDTIGGGLTLKPGLEGKLCNSFATASKVKEFDVSGTDMKKYLIEWTVIDWCAPHTSSARQFTYTQEVIATIDPDCDVSTGDDGSGDVSLVQGKIATEEGKPVQEVEMKALLGSGSPLTTVTGGEGIYNFSINEGSQVSLVPGKNTGHSNGVSTQDLIDIQRHVLQKKTLDSKYKKIAADVNGNGMIDGLDVLELRKMVMKPDSKFANNTSWRFFDTQTDKEVYNVSSLQGDMTVDWVGVKIGDVNLSGDPARSSRSTTGELHLNVANKTLKGGDVYRVDVTSDNFENITGMQYTLNYLTNLVEVESIEAGALNITKDNYLRYAPGVITSSWSEADGQSLSSDAVLFTLVLKAKSEVQLRDVLSLNSRVTATEAYDAAGGLKDVALHFNGTDSGFTLYQNTPNPYAGETVIGFKLPEASKATLSVYDVTGKVLKIVEGEYSQGYNEVQLKGSDLNTTGVLYYQLDTKMYTATKKMIVIE